MGKIRIGTRESQLATWQATQVKELLARFGFESELIFIKSEGDIDLITPLYEMGVKGIFTRSLDAALLNHKIDVAVHSMKDVPTQLPAGIAQVAVLQRGPASDLLVFKNEEAQIKYASLTSHDTGFIVATSSIRRKAQWLNKFPEHRIYNLRGNVNTRLKKLKEENWDAAIFAQAGLERINLRPPNSIVIEWMLPAPAQGAIVVAAREGDHFTFDACQHFNDRSTELCTKIERDFLRELLGGCSTPISALARINPPLIEGGRSQVYFNGNILSLDGAEKIEIEKSVGIEDAVDLGRLAALEILENGGRKLVESIHDGTE
ncbi:MAG TPA: hydroxymethylbilane synthase [Chitinophagaceae bacterium]|nr:hydroxymethylbilane synthase [Chitinophagaceae bacterium]